MRVVGDDLMYLARRIASRNDEDPPVREGRSCDARGSDDDPCTEKEKDPLCYEWAQNPGSVLLSHRVAPTVPLALESLTSVFGMGTGVTSPV